MWRFDILCIAYMVNSFVFSLDIPVMFNILYKMIKILHTKKMLNAIYLYWLHNDTSEVNNSLNGHFNEPWIINHQNKYTAFFNKILKYSSTHQKNNNCLACNKNSFWIRAKHEGPVKSARSVCLDCFFSCSQKQLIGLILVFYMNVRFYKIWKLTGLDFFKKIFMDPILGKKGQRTFIIKFFWN